jgi:uncharacterized membrane protein
VSDERRERVKSVLRVILAIGMITMGVLHFARADEFVAVMPPYLPAPLALVWISGVFEILGGAGVLVPRTRALAGLGLVLLYVAVFPANVHMALVEVPMNGSVPPRWAMWLRLPFQALFIAWAWWSTRPPRPRAPA